jgi:(2Fe-2S) ferredoxin
MVVYPDGVWYGRVDEESAREIVKQQIKKGRTVEQKVLYYMRRKEAWKR